MANIVIEGVEGRNSIEKIHERIIKFRIPCQRRGTVIEGRLSRKRYFQGLLVGDRVIFVIMDKDKTPYALWSADRDRTGEDFIVDKLISERNVEYK